MILGWNTMRITLMVGLFILVSVGITAPLSAYASDLVGHWKFDEASGATATDSSGNGWNGTLTNVTRSTSTLPSVEFTNVSSVFFNSASSGRIVSTNLSLNNYTQFTLAGWAYPTAANSRASWFGQNDIFEFGFSDSDTLVCYTSKGEVLWDFNPGTFLNAWHHITCLATPTQLIMYIDGTNVASTSISAGSFGSSGDKFSIGAGVLDGGTQGPFTGYIDDVRVYSRGLSPSEMEGLGNGESGPTNAPSIESTSPSDGATGVALNANLSFTFATTTMATSTGSIGLYKTSDNSLVESFSVTSSLLTRSVTSTSTTYTINPTADFAESTGYYISIASTTLRDGSNTFYEGTSSTTWNFTSGDFTYPTLSSVTAPSTASTSASIGWTTSEAASTKVVFGLTTSYSSTTAERDTSPRVTSHAITLSPLAVCTTYHYAAVSRDAAGNAATSTDATFTTDGCEYDATPTSATSTPITSSSGGSTEIEDDGKTFRVTAPAAATATSSSFVIQVKAIPSADVLTSLGRPTPAPNEVGVTVFDVKAIINGTTILDSFDAEVTIDYEYGDDEISGLDESTLWLYHYTGGRWVELNDCTVDTSANTISCTTPSFSIFGLFGNEEEESSSGGGGSISSTRFACRDAGASNYKSSGRHKQDLCTYETTAAPTSVCAPYMTGHLRYGADNDPAEVKKLEMFLNEKQGEKLPVDGGYGLEDVEAVKRFQEKYASEILGVWGLTEPTGYVYRTTLLKINSFYCNTGVTCPAFTEHNSLTENTSSAEVAKTKVLLSELGFYSSTINTTFDPSLHSSLKQFQETFSDTMLKPWGLAYGTGYKYKTTNKFLNMIVGCDTPAVELDGKGVFDY